MSYNFNKIEAKWQKYWKEKQTFRAENPDASGKTEKEGFYILDMFPYPSGAGLHVGHPLGYIASDIMARYKRHKGYNVLHPMGYDSFGLPAEQYAIQTGQHPAITTEANINRYREQLDKIGFSFDWSREVRTSDPEYYRWTQWIFIQLFESWYDQSQDKARPIAELVEIFEAEGNSEVQAVNDPVRYFSAEDWKGYSEKKQQEILLNYRLTYLAETEVNWCPGLGTVLANDEVINGVSERGGYPVEQKKMMQWSMRITAYAERLLKGLEQIDWSENLKETQRNWIGKSKGTQIDFRVLPNENGKTAPSSKEEEWEICDLPNHSNKHLYESAKEARENLTEAEKNLWAHLKDRNLGYLFKSHCILGEFMVNFVCPAKKLIVEIDSETYTKSDEYAEKRDDILKSMGYKVVNFTRTEVIDNLNSVLRQITDLLKDDEETSSVIRVFTTRPDTVFGVSFMTLAPEHELVKKITTSKQRRAVKKYVKATGKRTERERMADVKSISGVFTGAYAEHPFTKKPIPIWISDYVLASYGTGAVMAVPAGDDRDYRFAKHFDIPIPHIFEGIDISEGAFEEKGNTKLINSEFLDGLSYKKAIKKVNQRLENCGFGMTQINFRLRDAVFSRQRYWGEPFPIYYKEGIPYPLPESSLPLRLPEVEKYLPTEEGEPPLGRADVWHWNENKREVVAVENPDKLPEGVYKLELNTMPGWAGSSWYFFRYMETTKRNEVFASQKAMDYWNSVDLYIGGNEHATGHLLYSRFWVKFLKDRGWSPVEEPFKKLINQGMILGDSAFVHRVSGKNTLISANKIKKEKVDPLHALVTLVDSHGNLDIEGFKKWRPEFRDAKFITDENGDFKVSREVEKMSKSKYNVVNPDDICEEYGADSLRLYEMFLGPLEQSKPWNTAGLSGVYSFLNKLWRLYHSKGDLQKGEQIFYISEEKASKESLKTLHKTIEKVTEDIESFSFNTAVSSLMICVNDLTKQNCHTREVLEPLAVLISPYAPHIAEELWEKMGHTTSISEAPFPIFNERLVKETTKTYPISFNGKKRFTLDMSLELSKDEIEKIVMADERTQKQLNGRTPKRVIIVPGKIVNIVG